MSRSTMLGMPKPFASTADTAEKTATFEVLADGVYAYTAEGDPNVGAIEGSEAILAVEARASGSTSCGSTPTSPCAGWR